MKIRPLMGECLLYMETPPTESGGGIALLDTPSEGNDPSGVIYGEVRRLGIWELDGKGRMIPHPVKPGDRVAINSGAGRWLRSERERLKLVPAKSILAVVEKD